MESSLKIALGIVAGALIIGLLGIPAIAQAGFGGGGMMGSSGGVQSMMGAGGFGGMMGGAAGGMMGSNFDMNAMHKAMHGGSGLT
jgi:hypothetical protein